MLDLYTLEPQFWPDKTIPREYLDEEGNKPIKQEIQDTIKYILQNNFIEMSIDEEIEEDGTALTITVDDDDNSLFTVFIELVKLLQLNVLFDWYDNLEEIMECTYLDKSSNSKQNFNTLIKNIEQAIN